MIKISTNKSSIGFIILSTANIFCKVLSLLYIPFLIATIGDEGYGIYYAAYNVYAFVFMFALSGTSTVIPKLIAEYSAKGNELDAMASFKIGNRMMLCTGVFFASLMFFGAGKLVDFIGYQKAYLAILSLAPSIVLTAVNSSFRSYFQGRNNMTPIAISQVIEQIGNTVFTIGCSFALIKISLEWGVAGGALGTTLGAFITQLYLLLQYKKDKKIKRESNPRAKTDKEIFKYMFNFALPLIVSTGFIYAGNNLVDVANIKSGLLKSGFTDSYATIRYGNFGNFMQLVNVPMIIISSLSLTILPILAKANTLESKDELKNNIKQIFKISFLISIPSAVGLSVLSEPIFDMIFVSSQYKGSDLLKFGSFIIVSYSLFQLSNTILNSVGRVYKGTTSAMIGVIIKILSNFILIPIATINIFGAIIGLCLSQAIPFLLNYRHIKNHIGTKESLVNSWAKPLLSSAIMGICVFLTYNGLFKLLSLMLPKYPSLSISILASVYVGAVVYIKTMYITKGITEKDLSIVPKKLRKLVFI